MGHWYDYIKASNIQSQFKTSHNIVTVISFDVKSSSMIKQQSILAIIITSVFTLGTIGFGSFAMGDNLTILLFKHLIKQTPQKMQVK